jgi:hypothetical protein
MIEFEFKPAKQTLPHRYRPAALAAGSSNVDGTARPAGRKL